jgi:hypothetical protein
MGAVVTSVQVETVVRSALQAKGYKTSVERLLGETGTDIIATRDREVLHIEAIAFKKSGPARALDFYQAFFRAVSRLEHEPTKCIHRLARSLRHGTTAAC